MQNQTAKWINEIQCEIDSLKNNAGGGGSFGPITLTKLWEDPDGRRLANYTLSDSITNYDYIIIGYGVYSEFIGNSKLVSYVELPVELLVLNSDKNMLFNRYNSNMTLRIVNDEMYLSYDSTLGALQVYGVSMSPNKDTSSFRS